MPDRDNHGRDDMVFNREGWLVLVLYLVALAIFAGAYVWWLA